MDAEKLFERIIRAKVKLEELKLISGQHSSRCVVELDPEGYAPCNCGASRVRSLIDSALKSLEGK
jgi:hypothetical protein